MKKKGVTTLTTHVVSGNVPERASFHLTPDEYFSLARKTKVDADIDMLDAPEETLLRAQLAGWCDDVLHVVGESVELERYGQVVIGSMYLKAVLYQITLLAAEGPSPRIEFGLSCPAGMAAHTDCKGMTRAVAGGLCMPSCCVAVPVQPFQDDYDCGAGLVLSSVGMRVPMGVVRASGGHGAGRRVAYAPSVAVFCASETVHETARTTHGHVVVLSTGWESAVVGAMHARARWGMRPVVPP